MTLMQTALAAPLLTQGSHGVGQCVETMRGSTLQLALALGAKQEKQVPLVLTCVCSFESCEPPVVPFDSAHQARLTTPCSREPIRASRRDSRYSVSENSRHREVRGHLTSRTSQEPSNRYTRN